ncbi:hypothetical protein CYY_001263 [Polysphondylium violaceum]|uniref:Uncharacterized protein n=1 Tax=Polysphondylium violaceum TaxID=133409 RepID=A0A8J4VAQ9_9MYCE|nr:hypothetical protein CYY_001263 [Polysphondylium violaceum]
MISKVKSVLFLTSTLITLGTCTSSASSFISPSDLTRYDFNRDKVDPVFDLENSEYVQSLIVLGFPGLFLCIFILLLGVLGLFIRNCVTCGCGKNKKELSTENTESFETSSWAEFDYRKKPKEYKKKFGLGFIKFLLFIVIITTVVGVILGFASNSVVSDKMDGFFIQMEKTANDAKVTLSFIVKNLAGSTDEGSIVRENIKPFSDALANVTKTTKDARVTEKNLNMLRDTIVIMGYIIAIITCGWAVFGLANGKAWSFMFLSYLSLLCISITFLAMGLHVPLSAATSDLCDSLDQYVETGVPTVWMNEWFDCQDNSTVNKAFEYSELEINKLLDMLNKFTLELAGMTFTMTNITKLNINKLRVLVPIDQLDLFDSKFNMHTIDVISSIPKLKHIASCEYVKDFFLTVQDEYCDDIIENSNRLIISEILISVIWIPGFIFALIYSKDKKIDPKDTNNNTNNNSDTASNGSSTENMVIPVNNSH